MDGHERSWSWSWTWSWTWTWAWTWACPYPWNRHKHMRVQTQRQALACKSDFRQLSASIFFTFSDLGVENKLLIKDPSHHPTVMKIGTKVNYYQYFSNLLKKNFQHPPPCWGGRRTDIFVKRPSKSSDTPPEVK